LLHENRLKGTTIPLLDKRHEFYTSRPVTVIATDSPGADTQVCATCRGGSERTLTPVILNRLPPLPARHSPG